jgi:hypothetical protein
MKTKTQKQSWKLGRTAKSNSRARLQTAQTLADLADKKCQDLIFPVFVYRTIMRDLR